MTPRERLHIADKIALPLDWMTMATVVYGARGSGKSTLGAVVAEELDKAKQRFCAIDLKGDFYGLKSSRDGKSEAIPVVIFGGDHKDLPLEEGAGKFVAETIANLDQSTILDLEHFSKGKQIRFLGEFFAALYDANRDPLLMILDEAQRYAPQKPISPDSAVCLGAVEDLVKLGRKHGLGVMLLTQRGSGLNKEVSEICDMLVAFRTPGPLDQGRVSDWLEANCTEDERDTAMQHISGLDTGTAVFASGHPALKLFGVAHVRERETFDSSATPKVGQRKAEPKNLAKPDLAALEVKMAASIERAKSEDPKALRAEVASLKKQLAAAGNVKVETKTVEVPILTDKDRKALDDSCLRLEAIADWFADAKKILGEAAAGLRATLSPLSAAAAKPSRTWPDQFVVRKLPAKTMRAIARDIREHPGRITSAPRASVEGVDGALTGPERKLLTALAQHGRMSKTKLAVLTGYSQQGGGFRNPLGRLRTREFVKYLGGDDVQATDLGIQELGEFEPLPTGTALLEQWLGQLSGPESKILRALADAYPKALDAETLAERTGYAADGGGFRNPLGRLRTLELVTRGQEIRASDALFGDGQ